MYYKSYNTMEQLRFIIPSKQVKFHKTFFSVVHRNSKDF